MTYTNHSGGCLGADMAWETAGIEYGVKTIAYSFEGHTQYGANQYVMTTSELNGGWDAAKMANHTLARNLYGSPSTYVRKLICRNWYQIKHADAVFSIGMLDGDKKHIVSGGTGWAVQMAVDNNKPVYLYEQNLKQWMKFVYQYEDSQVYRFQPIDYIPQLTHNFAGIGTRKITDGGLQAIIDVFRETFI